MAIGSELMKNLGIPSTEFCVLNRFSWPAMVTCDILHTFF
jgi:hypothetical protein